MFRSYTQGNAKHDESDCQIHQIDTLLIKIQLYKVELIQIPEEGKQWGYFHLTN